MVFDVLTIFPNLIEGYLSDSILKREIKKNTIKVRTHNIRDYSKDKHHKVDDTPYGGGAGMIMTPQPLFDSIQKVKKLQPRYAKTSRPVIYLTPTGKKLDYPLAKKLAGKKGLILICGRYEGIDERIRELCVDEEISIGDYVLSGGELAALVLIEAVTRLLPGALGNESSAHEDSFTEALDGKKEYPHFTRPRVFKSLEVPDILLTGNHKKIEAWRKKYLR